MEKRPMSKYVYEEVRAEDRQKFSAFFDALTGLAEEAARDGFAAAVNKGDKLVAYKPKPDMRTRKVSIGNTIAFDADGDLVVGEPLPWGVKVEMEVPISVSSWITIKDAAGCVKANYIAKRVLAEDGLSYSEDIIFVRANLRAEAGKKEMVI